MMDGVKKLVLSVAAIFCLAAPAPACGPFFPNTLLDDGDHAVLQPPIADFERELARMKITPGHLLAVPHAPDQSYFDQSTELEMSDLAAALKQAGMSSAQATVVMQSHLAERMKLRGYLTSQEAWASSSPGSYYTTNGECILLPSTNPPPPFPDVVVTPGLPREFAEYFGGAIAWHTNGTGEAAEHWLNLLALPPKERHFKSTWAAFMLGEYYASPTYPGSDDDAIKYFSAARELARKGFADSTGLAVFSLGEEARVWMNRTNYERALELYLQQYAADERSALNSLRFAAARALVESNSTPAELKALARNPRTRRVITAYMISRHPYTDRGEAANDADAKSFFDRTDNWLAAVDAAGVKDVDSAELLALAAYQAGNMDAARHWVAHAGGRPVALWLQAKLLLRDGKLDEAAKLLAQVSRQFPRVLPGTNTPAGGFADNLFIEVAPEWNESIAVGRQSLAELGVLHLARRDYTEALDLLLRSGYWTDAAYVAERVLATDELKRYVDRHWPALPAGAKDPAILRDTAFDYEESPFNPRQELRYLLARRLARETASRDALNYYPTNCTESYQTLLDELQTGHNLSLLPEIRAQNLFAAAVITRLQGMELFGTELDPDYEIYGGDFDYGYTWQSRSTNAAGARINVPNADEIARASSRPVDPDKRFHYRWQAAALAWEAAQLLPNNNDETARVLCTAGTWLKYRDPQSADKFYKALVRRCRKTELGDQADKLRWFPAQPDDGNPPRLETIEITADLTNAVAMGDNGNYSTQFPFPGRSYSINQDEDVYVIAQALRRLGLAMTAEDILKANPGLRRGPLPEGLVITIPPAAASHP
jgi:hypothetical protein